MTQTALITGSSKGIGKGIASVLVENGYRVIVNGRTEADVNQTCQELGALAVPLVADLSQKESLESELTLLKEKGFIPDLVVANIGSGKSQSGWNIPIEEFQRQFDGNFFNAVMLATQSLNLFLKNKGHIVFVASIAGCEEIGAPIAYTSAKAALIAYSKALSNQVSRQGVRVNCVSPGNVFFEGGTWDLKLKQNKEATLDYIKKNVPLDKFGTPEEIGRAVHFLDQNPFITGSNLVVDGGQLHRMV